MRRHAVIVLANFICLSGLVPAVAEEVSLEDMARVFLEFDRAFLARAEPMSPEDRLRLDQLVEEGIMAFWEKDHARVLRSFARARDLTRGEPWDVAVERLDSISVRLPVAALDGGATEVGLRLVSLYEPFVPDAVRARIEVFEGEEPEGGCRMHEEDRSLSPAELAVGWTVQLPVHAPRTLVRVELSTGERRQLRERILFRIPGLEERIAAIERGVDEVTTGSADDLRMALADLREQIGPESPARFDVLDLLERLEGDLAAARAGRDPLAGRTGVVLRGARAANGEPVLYRVVLPEDYDPSKVYPAVVGLHGLRLDERSMMYTYAGGGLVREAARRGYILIAPRSEDRHTRASLTLGDTSSDDHVLAAVEDALARYSIDPRRIHAFGHSLGAIQVLQTAAREPARFASIVPIGLTAILDPRRIENVPTLMLFGEKDPAAPAIHAFLFAAKIVGCQNVESKEIAAMGHVLILHFETGTVFDWFDAHGGGGGPRPDSPGLAMREIAVSLARGDPAAFWARLAPEGRAALGGRDGLRRGFATLREEDQDVASHFRGRWEGLAVEAERLLGPDEAEVAFRFADGTPAARRLHRVDGRWRVEWEAADGLARR
ncbi:MAG: hypothetical protein HY720_22475 [Planctomycetes bacterium]|nr:hypothetical protein [Planctomycetota bacterium]